MGCTCKNTTYTKLSKQDILDLIEQNNNAITVVDIQLNQDNEWELVFSDGSTKPFRKADTDLNGDVLEEEV